MMKQSERIAARPGFRHFRVPGMGCRFAMLAALATSMGCSSDPDGELPLKPCGVEETLFGDEVQLSYLHRAYDERGNHVLSERDRDADGTVDDQFAWEYAPGGGLTLVKHSWSSGTTHEAVAQYDDGDRLVSITWNTGATSNRMAGRVDYEYDGEQRILEHWDRDNDGAVEEIATYTYDADGKLQGVRSRCAGDVEPGFITTLQWGEGGRIERIESRQDGELDVVTQFIYDQDGLLERWERVDGSVVYSITYEFDSEGNVTETNLASVRVLGEMPPTWSVRDTVYDADGRILSLTETSDGEPVFESTYLYECPDHEDSPGRYIGEPRSPLPSPPMGPRGGADFDAMSVFTLNFGGSCP